jgi:hypothetical protein
MHIALPFETHDQTKLNFVLDQRCNVYDNDNATIAGWIYFVSSVARAI